MVIITELDFINNLRKTNLIHIDYKYPQSFDTYSIVFSSYLYRLYP